MLSKRKALIGYGVYTAGKPIAKRAVRNKAKNMAPSRKPERKGVAAGVVAAVAAAGAAIGGLMFWRKRRNGGGESTPK